MNAIDDLGATCLHVIKAMNASTLLELGYFPKELPTVFVTEPFSRIEGFLSLDDVKPTLGNKRLVTRPATHNLARPGGQRRKLHIPNPFSYWRLCDLLADNWSEVEQQLQKSAYSRSKPIEDPSGNRALRTESDGDELPAIRASNRQTARYVLRTDISRFYSSIYTHSVEWAIEGKFKAKSKLKAGRGKASQGFGESLDISIRELQDLQSLGIPVGPDASLVIAELIAGAIDSLLTDKGLVGFRFMDDYELCFQSRAEAESGLVLVEQALAEFELAVNPSKTSIDELPVELDSAWRTKIAGYTFRSDTSVSDAELIQYFNTVFGLKARYRYAAVLAYSIRRLNSCAVENWELLQSLMYQCVLKEPGAIDPMISLMEARGEGNIEEDFDTLIHQVIEHNVPLDHGSELAWAIWAAIWFRRSIPKQLAEKLDGNPDPTVALLTLHARDIGLMTGEVEFPAWSSVMTQESLYNGQWLLAYEADLKGWLPPAGTRNHVDQDLNFAKLKELGISFFDPDAEAPTRALLKRRASDTYE